eukprot:TRINITY_DN1567_c0_g1::TRINITY_DN1567_c0_g1_i1::g.28298::m.28298 TRINITY_DN1567_c0_g1::TRINITY_DN1567_c0_g1_i1::g.28298  ORF type:complete len:126 (+),score=2.13,HTH_29/PF13551.1/1.8e-11,HTH_23/PF13384.1/1.7e-07,HTH_23/PF13384.1/4.4e+02,HTH_32/PF13565.1/4.9e-07,HTH_Tnp_1/PF01527.15/2.5e-05,HTH_7/PF02796.10/0.00012,HTH_7/PF02796.10/8.7e+02,HTH_28/PF13518.1/8.8e-05,HTH_28/PF13518.1/2.4e+03,HTH_Tnp_Tc3_2/PF01498.13/5.6e-05,HTH_17/PF12728.2/0.024,HTH_17/PF12728.2/77,HTH_33/PF13592.1/5.2e+03,HTH_33/PF
MNSREKKRERAVALRNAGISVVDTCDILGVAPSSVWRWCQKEKAGQDLSDQPRSGRPHAITPQISRAIVKQVRGKLGVSTRDVSKNIKQKTGITIDQSTIVRHLKNLGMKYSVNPPKEKLTPSHM